MRHTTKAVTLALLALGATSVLQAEPPTEAKKGPEKKKKLPYCDEIKEPPAGEYTCQLKNVWKPIPQPKLEQAKPSKSKQSNN